jgi:transcriptional regulator with XRE-family HTH domain
MWGHHLDANVIRNRRTAKAWTQAHLAQAAGVDAKTIRRAEAGKKISDESRLAIAAVLGLDAAALARRAPLIVVGFANEAAGTGKTFYALNQAVMAQYDGFVAAIVAFAPAAMSCFDEYAVAFCRDHGIAHRRAEPGQLRQALEEVAATVVFIDTPPRITGGGFDAAGYYRELAGVCDFIIVPLTAGRRAERAARITAKQLRQHTDRVVFLPYEVLPKRIGWIGGVTAYGQRLGIVTLDWLPHCVSDFEFLMENYRLALGAGSTPPDLDESFLGAFFGIWTDIKRWALPRPSHRLRWSAPTGIRRDCEDIEDVAIDAAADDA